MNKTINNVEFWNLIYVYSVCIDAYLYQNKWGMHTMFSHLLIDNDIHFGFKLKSVQFI